MARRRPWTAAEDAKIRAMGDLSRDILRPAGGLALRLAAIIDRTPEAIRMRASRLGVPLRCGLTLARVARRADVSVRTLQRARQERVHGDGDP